MCCIFSLRFRGLPVTLELVKEAQRDLLRVREIASMMTFQAVNFPKIYRRYGRRRKWHEASRYG